MATVGVICEYNPFHNGHLRQIREIRRHYGKETTVVCLMSGNFTQRGEPALFAKEDRAKAAVLCGADLVLELPVTCAIASAERFAEGGVRIFSALQTDALSFGTENGTKESLFQTAEALCGEAADRRILEELKTGCSYGTARQRAADAIGIGELIKNSNDILAVEYCKAILRLNSNMDVYPVSRTGNYLAVLPDRAAPSALAVRRAILKDQPWKACVPAQVRDLYQNADRYTMKSGERAMLARLRTLPDTAFENLPYGNEGLWRKCMHSCRTGATLEEIVSLTKSKRYTRARIVRMLLCAYLGLTSEDLRCDPPYVRILAFTDRGREALRRMKGTALPLIEAGSAGPDPEYDLLERRCSDLYGLFYCGEAAKPCGRERKIRIFYGNP